MARFGSDRFGGYYPPSKPLAVDGGITTSKQRGAMAHSWWSKRFTDVLESFGLGGRMARGRRYARTGQVISLDVAAGSITADVQGSRPQPYSVVVRHTAPTEQQWHSIDVAFATQIGLAAEMMAGAIPTEIEELFSETGVDLLPSSWRSLEAVCSCPDWGDPCKHTAAVLYVFADMLDADPWLLLVWHGRTRYDVLEGLRVAGAEATDGETPVTPWWPLTPGGSDPGEAEPHLGAPSRLAPRAATAPEPPDAVLARCEPTNLELRGRGLLDYVAPAYEAMMVVQRDT